MTISISGLSGWFASAMEIFKQYAPLSWIAVGLFFGGCFVLVYYILQLALRYKTERDLMQNYKERNTSVNPLDDNFNKLRIKIADLAHPLTKKIENKKFINCQLIGPANIVMMGRGNLDSVAFLACDVIVIKEQSNIHNVIPLENVVIIGGEISNCTIYIVKQQADQFKLMGATIISDTDTENGKTINSKASPKRK